MEKLLDTGKVKSIGISNFSKKELETLLKTAKVVPSVHQIETHPYLQQTSFLEFHKKHGIEVTAYSPFGNQNDIYDAGKNVDPLVKTEVIQKIAKKHGVEGTHVAIAWGIQRGTTVIPKSVHEERIKNNFEALKLVGKLDDEDMKSIASMNGPHRFNNPSKSWGYKCFDDLEGA
jgi:diketogulonate reductase-like aldo/keto reductase